MKSNHLKKKKTKNPLQSSPLLLNFQGFENSNLRKSLSMSIPKTVDSLLRSDSFTAILTDLENASPSLYFSLFRLQFKFYFVLQAKKLEENHAWLVETLSLFEKPNAASRVALNQEKIKAVSNYIHLVSYISCLIPSGLCHFIIRHIYIQGSTFRLSHGK